MPLIIGVPRETFAGETRVATVPEVVTKLKKQGYQVVVESGAGQLSNIGDDEYREAGAEVLGSAAEVWSKALFLEGPAGIGPAARARGLAAWWVDARGTLSMTPAARQVTTWVRAEAGLSPP